MDGKNKKKINLKNYYQKLSLKNYKSEIQRLKSEIEKY